MPREADSDPGGGGSTLSVGQSSTSLDSNATAARRVWAWMSSTAATWSTAVISSPSRSMSQVTGSSSSGSGLAPELLAQPAERRRVVDRVDDRDRPAHDLGVELGGAPGRDIVAELLQRPGGAVGDRLDPFVDLARERRTARRA